MKTLSTPIIKKVAVYKLHLFIHLRLFMGAGLVYFVMVYFENTWRRWFSSSSVSVQGIELCSLELLASVFTNWAILVVLSSIFFNS